MKKDKELEKLKRSTPEAVNFMSPPEEPVFADAGREIEPEKIKQPERTPWGKTSNLSFKEQTDIVAIGNFIEEQTHYLYKPEDMFDENFDIDKQIFDDVPVEYIPRLIEGSNSQYQFDRAKQKILEEVAEREKIANGSPIAALVGGAGGAIFSLSTFLIPALGYQKFTNIGKGAAMALKRTWPSLIAQDATRNFLRSTDSYTRDGSDFLVDTLIDSAFTGAITAGAGAYAGRALRAQKEILKRCASKGVDMEIKIDPLTGEHLGFRATMMEGFVDPADAAGLAAQQQAVREAQAFVDFGLHKYGNSKIFKALFGQSPIIRAATSPYTATREFIGNFFSLNTARAGVFNGQQQLSSEAAAKFLVSKSQSIAADARDIYWDYALKDMGLAKFSPLKRVQAVLLSQKPKPGEFFKEVGRAIANANNAEWIADESLRTAVEKAATLIKSQYDLLAQEMVRSGVLSHLPEQVKGNLAYLNRIYDVEAMIRDPEGFIENMILGLRDFNSRVTPYWAHLDRLNHELKALQMTKKFKIEPTDVEGAPKKGGPSLLERIEKGDIPPELAEHANRLKEIMGLSKSLSETEPRIKEGKASSEEANLKELIKAERERLQVEIDEGRIPAELLTKPILFSAEELEQFKTLSAPIRGSEAIINDLKKNRKARRAERLKEYNATYKEALKKSKAELNSLEEELKSRFKNANKESPTRDMEAQIKENINEKIKDRRLEYGQQKEELNTKYQEEKNALRTEAAEKKNTLRAEAKEKKQAIYADRKSLTEKKDALIATKEEEQKAIRKELENKKRLLKQRHVTTDIFSKENRKIQNAANKLLIAKDKEIKAILKTYKKEVSNHKKNLAEISKDLNANLKKINSELASTLEQKENNLFSDLKKSVRDYKDRINTLKEDKRGLESFTDQQIKDRIKALKEEIENTKKTHAANAKAKLKELEENATEAEKIARENEKIALEKEQIKLDEAYAQLERDALAGKIDKRFFYTPKLKSGKPPKYKVKLKDLGKKPFLRRPFKDVSGDDLKGIAVRYYNNITKQNAAKQMAKYGEANAPRGEGSPIKGRVNPVHERFLEPYLVRNALQLLELHTGFVAKHVGAADAWARMGTTPSKGLLTIHERIKKEYDEFKKSAKSPGELSKLDKEYRKNLDLVDTAYAIYWGDFNAAGNRFAAVKEIAAALRITKMYNVMRMLGNLVLIQGPEYFANMMEHGPWRAIKTPLKFAISKSYRQMTRKQARWASVALHSTQQKLIDHMFGSIGGEALAPGLIERTVEKATRVTVAAGGTNIVGDLLETVSAEMAIQHSMDTLKRMRLGQKVSKADTRRLAFLGLSDAEMLPRLQAQVAKHGSDFGSWTDGAASLAFQKAVHREVNMLILKPNLLDIPFYLRNPFVSVMTQFMNYMFGATNSILLKLLQAPDANRVMGALMMMAWGAFVDPMRQISRGEKPDLDARSLLTSAIVNSAILGVVGHEVQMLMSVINSPLTNMLTGDRFKTRKYESALIGPTGSFLSALQESVNMGVSGQFNEKGVKALRNLLPSIFHNWYTTWLTNNMIEGLGLPKTQGEAEGYFGTGVLPPEKRPPRQKLFS